MAERRRERSRREKCLGVWLWRVECLSGWDGEGEDEDEVGGESSESRPVLKD